MQSPYSSRLLAQQQYRSQIGRRPPFYPLKASTHIDDPTITLENLELGDAPTISMYRTPEGIAAGGIRAWNEAHEAITRWFLDPASPVLVDSRFPDQHAPVHLSEMAFAARMRCREENESRAEALATFLNNDSDFPKKCLEPWKRLSESQQEELVLSVLESMEPPQHVEITESTTYGKNRKLVPELELSKLCERGGEGLVDFLKLVALHTLDPVALSSHPIPNEAIFKKFGVPSSEMAPMNKSDRAFQDEYMLMRNFLILVFVQKILYKLSGRLIGTIIRGTSSYESEITRSNLPSLADNFAQGTPNKKLRADFQNLSEEKCSACHATAKELGIKALMYCQRCKQLDRIQPYCSRVCQTADWQGHKILGHCGSKLSSFISVPVITSSPFTPDYPAEYPDRRSTLTQLDKNPLALWTFKVNAGLVPKVQLPPEATGYVNVRLDRPCEPLPEQRMLQGIREIAYDALRNGTQSSIDILAFVLVRSQNQVMQELSTIPDLDPNKMPDVPITQAKEATFRSLFGLEEEAKWEAALARGAVEIEKPGREIAKEYHLFQNKCYHSHMLDLCAGSKPGTPQVARDFMKAVFMAMLKEQCGFSDKDIGKAFQKVDGEALSKAMEETSLVDEPEGGGGAARNTEDTGDREATAEVGESEGEVKKKSKKNKKKKSKK
ncbi:hypothetical protein JCM5350_000621 [Sporobolomyces pararoseus]